MYAKFIIALIRLKFLAEEINRADLGWWSWWKRTREIIRDYLHQSRKNFEEAFNELKGQGFKAVEIGKDTLADLKKQYDDIRNNAAEAYENTKNFWTARLEEARQTSNESYRDALVKAEEAFHDQKELWQTQLEQWKQEVQRILKEHQKQ